MYRSAGSGPDFTLDAGGRRWSLRAPRSALPSFIGRRLGKQHSDIRMYPVDAPRRLVSADSGTIRTPCIFANRPFRETFWTYLLDSFNLLRNPRHAG